MFRLFAIFLLFPQLGITETHHEPLSLKFRRYERIIYIFVEPIHHSRFSHKIRLDIAMMTTSEEARYNHDPINLDVIELAILDQRTGQIFNKIPLFRTKQNSLEGYFRFKYQQQAYMYFQIRLSDRQGPSEVGRFIFLICDQLHWDRVKSNNIKFWGGIFEGLDC